MQNVDTDFLFSLYIYPISPGVMNIPLETYMMDQIKKGSKDNKDDRI